MRTRSDLATPLAIRFAAAALIAATAFAGQARAEKVPLSPAAMQKMATNVIVGKVKAVYVDESETKDWRVWRCVAEVTVDQVEKGTGLEPGQLVYVRYWQREWIGRDQMPPGTNGHSDMASVGETARYYLVNQGYDGAGQVEDGGYNVVFRNGCEVLSPADAPAAAAGPAD